MNRRNLIVLMSACLLLAFGAAAVGEDATVPNVSITDGGIGLLSWFVELSIYPVDPVTMERELDAAATFGSREDPIELVLPAGEYEIHVAVSYLPDRASYGRFLVEQGFPLIVDLRDYELPEILVTY